ncbi:hypothetical protein ERX37_07945 [Macrococcus hajekii]|uniref:Uncharacterized protein n=1 Tax=Macrococcus hajekii TaxID=198482 RepID=A0A4V3BDV3_9STAP|nr:hypothetical protein [Macrococcus hajekii]TDM01424.1 hypothetical protein ERX37_07945 [Macrococcus hajekii]GGA99862.1 hypothetical protein GCM10007190_04890 [Macrococcus hajekii]
MKQDAFKQYGLSRYASQILQRYRRYAQCTYKLTDKGSIKQLEIAEVIDNQIIEADTWDAVAYKLNERMYSDAFMRLMIAKERWATDGDI